MPETLIEKEMVEMDIPTVAGVDRAANKRIWLIVKRADTDDINKALWSAAQINDLPDSSFAVIEPGGTKDETGRTVPRGLRHLPYKDGSGKVDLPHLRNALSRLPQTNISAELKAKAKAKLEAAAREAGIETGTEKRDSPSKEDENRMTEEEIKALQKKVTDSEAALKEANEKVAKLEGELAEVKKSLKPEPEDIWKGVNPEVRKQFEAQKTRAEEAEKVAKAERDQRIEKEYIAKAEKLTDIPNLKSEDFGKVLKALSEKAPEHYAAIETALTAANETLKTNNVLLQAIGKSGPVPNSAEARLEEIAKRYHAEKKAPTFEQAYDLALKDNPDLYAQYNTEKRQGVK
ncbi:MAG: hypothetical protein WC359_14820 [Dehalococcoidia bacterium]|jgi:hypothetical protein